MAFDPKDIELQKRLLRSYERQAESAVLRQVEAERAVRALNQAVRSTKEILRAAGEDV